MTWTRLDDTWTDGPVLADLSIEDRWHLLCMIQFCSRIKKYDGILRAADARRCSDHPEPSQAIQHLTEVGLVSVVKGGYQINTIDDHIPPPSVRESSEKAAIRQRRSRKHKNGDHSECLPDHCANASVTRNVTPNVTRDTRTGQDGTGKALESRASSFASNEVSLSSSEAAKDQAWSVGIPSTTGDDPGRCATPNCGGRVTEHNQGRGIRECLECIRGATK